MKKILLLIFILVITFLAISVITSYRPYLIATSSLPEITFYGRIVDQYGVPVKSAKVWYSGENAYLSAGSGRGYVNTNNEGYFHIETTGASLLLGAVTHPEIDDISYQKPKRLRSGTRPVHESIITFEHSSRDGYMLSWKNHTTKDGAFIISAWRLEKYDGAIGSGASLRINSDGKLYTLRLDEVVRKRRLIEGEKDGTFHISCTRTHMKNNQDYGDWNISFEPVKGGIQETNDVYMNIAPETGYIPSLDIDMRTKNNDFVHVLRNKRYYFTVNNGKSFGSLFVQFQPFYNHKKEVCNIRMKYKINSTGSRNLELNN